MGKRMWVLFLLAAFLLTACGSEERAETRDVKEAFVEMFLPRIIKTVTAA